MSDQQVPDQQFKADFQRQAELLSWSLVSPEAIARALGDWLKSNHPDRLDSAQWITVDGQKDTGLSVRLMERPLAGFHKLKFSVAALLGRWSIGAAVSTQLYSWPGGAGVSLGVGAVTPFADLGKWEPVVVVTVRF